MNPGTSSYNIIHLLADKSVHVTLFCVLAILLWFALPGLPRKVLTVVACGAVVGSCSEFLQRFFPGRDPAIRDVLINIGGTALGITVCLISRLTPQVEVEPPPETRSQSSSALLHQ